MTCCNQKAAPPTPANAMQARSRRPLVVAEYIAFLSIACEICKKWIHRGRIEAVDGPVPPLTFEHDHRCVVCAKQAKYAGRTLLGIVQYDGRRFAFGRRIQTQHQAVSSCGIKEKEPGAAVRGHGQFRAQLAACICELDPACRDYF